MLQNMVRFRVSLWSGIIFAMGDCVNSESPALNGPISVRTWGAAIHIATAAREAAIHADAEWARLVLIPIGLLNGELQEISQIARCPKRPTIPGELVRVHFNFSDGIPIHKSLLCDLVRMDIEPFIIGVGKICVYEIEKGFVVSRRQLGQYSFDHDLSPLSSSLIS